MSNLYKCEVSGKRCAYWKPITTATDTKIKCCHYCVIEGRMRARDENGNCLSVRTRPLTRGKIDMTVGFARSGR